MGRLVWICMLPFVIQVDSYVLMTADVDDVHTLAKQVLRSPVVQQLKDIWSTASRSFDKHYTRFRADDDEENSDPTYALARKVLKLPVIQQLKAVIRRATHTFIKHYRAQDGLSGSGSNEQKALNSKRKNFDRRKAVDQFLELGRNASIYLRSMKELFEKL